MGMVRSELLQNTAIKTSQQDSMVTYISLFAHYIKYFAVIYLQVLERLMARRDIHAQTVSPIGRIKKNFVINCFCNMSIYTNMGMT